MSARDDLLSALAPAAWEVGDPKGAVQRHMARTPLKRFYKNATIGEGDSGFNLLLDGRPARTPGRNLLAVPTRKAAESLAAEWRACGEFIDPTKMPVTRILHSALDGVAREIAAVQAEIVKYAGSDLVCYRAGEPASLVAAQSAAWDPVVAFAREALGARLALAQGVVFARQPEHAIAAITAAVAAFRAALPLACLHVMTTLAGSALLALSVAHQRLSPENAWAAAHVDEDFQARAWGADHEDEIRRALRWTDFAAAAAMLRNLTQ